MCIILCSRRPAIALLTPDIWDDRTTEIESVHVIVKHYLRGIGIGKRLKTARRIKRTHKSSYLDISLTEKAILKSINLLRCDKRFVALYVDYHIGIRAECLICFKTAVGTATMLRGSHDDVAAETGHFIINAGIISSYQQIRAE